MKRHTWMMVLLIWSVACATVVEPTQLPAPTVELTVTPEELSRESNPETSLPMPFSSAEIAAIEAAWQTDHRAVSGITVMHKGAVVYEDYGSRQTADSLMEIYSTTKSVTALLPGIALHNGDLASLDVLVADLLPDYMADADPQLQSMTVEHLLTMSSGLTSGWEFEGSPINAHRGDLYERALAMGYANDPGEVAFYNTLASNLMTGVLEAATGQDLEAYAAEHLFAPLGIEDWFWYRDDNERATSGAGLQLRTADIALIGQLVLNEGVWEEERLISAEFIQTATSPLVNAPHWEEETLDYGYLFWVPELLDDQPTIVGFGYAGQTLAILPESELVVAMSSPCCSGGWSNLQLVTDVILPAVEGDLSAAAAPCTETVGAVSSFDLLVEKYGLVKSNIYLPPCYADSFDSYPVLYLLHGGGLNGDTWFRHIHADRAADQLIAEGEIEPLILVSPHIMSFGDGAQFEQYMLDQLIPHVDQNYRTEESRGQRGLAGLSLGGGLTAYIGLQHPDQFGALGLLSIATMMRGDQLMGEWLDAVPADLMPALYLDIGESDGLLGQHRALHEQLLARDIPHENFVRDGDHSLPYWQANTAEYLRWFDAQFAE